MTCERLQPRKLMEQPLLLVEVLSPSTRRTDFGVKILGYQELPSAREIWAVDSEERSVRVWRRAGDEWIMTLPIRAGVGRVREVWCSSAIAKPLASAPSTLASGRLGGGHRRCR